VLPLNLSLVCWQMNEKSPLIVWMLSKTSEKSHKWWWYVWLRHWNKSAVVGVDGENVDTTKKKHVRVAQMWRWCWWSFYWMDILHHEFVPRGEIVNTAFHFKLIKRLKEKVRRKRPGACTNKTWMLHRDKAPAHVSLLIREFLAKDETSVDRLSIFGSCEVFLLSKLKSTLKCGRFQTVEKIEENSL
jgi:hypothetical protein